MGKIAAGFLMIRFEHFGEVLALKRSSRIYLCNFSFCFWFAMLAVEEELSNYFTRVIFFVLLLVCVLCAWRSFGFEEELTNLLM